MMIRKLRRLVPTFGVAVALVLSACGGSDDDSTRAGGSGGAGGGCIGGSCTTDTDTVPVISGQPQSINGIPGTRVLLKVTATGSASLNYEWRLNGVAIAGADPTISTYLTPTLTVANDGDKYSVVVSDSKGSVTSATASVAIGADAGFDLMELVYHSSDVSTGGAAPFALLVDETLTVQNLATVVASGTVNATLDGGALPAAGHALPNSGTLAATLTTRTTMQARSSTASMVLRR